MKLTPTSLRIIGSVLLLDRKTDEYKLYHNMFRVEGWDVEQ